MFELCDTGSILAVSEWAIISQGGGHYWLPSDKYIVAAHADSEEFVLTSKLESIRDEVLCGSFKRSKQPKVTLQKAHQAMTGLSPGGKKKCTCKSGCTRHCGCWKSKTACCSSCGCCGNCDNPYN